jgi:hypothetical protein
LGEELSFPVSLQHPSHREKKITIICRDRQLFGPEDENEGADLDEAIQNGESGQPWLSKPLASHRINLKTDYVFFFF